MRFPATDIEYAMQAEIDQLTGELSAMTARYTSLVQQQTTKLCDHLWEPCQDDDGEIEVICIKCGIPKVLKLTRQEKIEMENADLRAAMREIAEVILATLGEGDLARKA